MKKKRKPPLELRNPIWDSHLIPGVRELEEQQTRALPRAMKPDPLQFVITSMLLPMDKKTRIRTLNFIRRTRNAYEEYRHACRAYRAFFSSRDNTQKYFDALHHFEVCLGCAYQGHELLFGTTQRTFFSEQVPGRSQLNWRMGHLYNRSKHTEGMIKSSQFDGKTLALWISNKGLETSKESMSFAELHYILYDMSVTACILAKSFVWRGAPVPEELIRHVEKVFRAEDRI